MVTIMEWLIYNRFSVKKLERIQGQETKVIKGWKVAVERNVERTRYVQLG